MTILHYIAQSILYRLPDFRTRKQLLWRIRKKTHKALQEELSRIPVIESGIEKQGEIPFIILENGLTLFGKPPTDFQRDIYLHWEDCINPEITMKTIGVAIDAITRYFYPHAMPQLTMPYPRKLRSVFGHRQHIETIEDLPDLSQEEREELKNIFSPKAGEVFLDVGSYMGYGAIRLSQIMDIDSHVIAVEAEPSNLNILTKNVKHNNINNITIVPKAIWNHQGILDFHRRGKRQANSLVGEIVNPSDSIQVEVTTIDDLLYNLEIKSINLLSMTINGAEVEAIEGMKKTLVNSNYIRMRIAGWYERDGRRISDIISPMLTKHGYEVAIGIAGGLLAWKI
jgi:FkbM family methyltransferase